MNKQIKKLVMIIGVMLLLMGVVVGFLLIQSGKTDEAQEAKMEAYRSQWGYNERVAEISDILRLEEYQAKELIEKILETVEVDRLGPIERGEGGYSIETEVEGYPITVTLLAGEIREIRSGRAIIYRKRAEAGVVTAEREYTFQEYKREVNQIAKSMKIEPTQAHKVYQKMIEAQIYTVRNLTRDRKSGNYIGEIGELNVELEMSGDVLTGAKAIMPEMGVSVTIFDANTKGTMQSVTPMGAGRGVIQGGLEYQVSQRVGVPVEKVRLPVALPDAVDTWGIIQEGTTRYIKVPADIDMGKGIKQEQLLIKQEDGVITYLKVGKKEY